MARTLLGGLEHVTFNFFVFAARLLLVCVSIHLPCCWSVHKSLAPRTRTLLVVLGQATLNFVAVATLLFFFFCVCPKFCDLTEQRRKIFVGVSEIRKSDFALFFFWLCVFFLVFSFSSAAIVQRLIFSDRDEGVKIGDVFSPYKEGAGYTLHCTTAYYYLQNAFHFTNAFLSIITSHSNP